MSKLVYLTPNTQEPFTTSEVIAECAGVKRHAIQSLIQQHEKDFREFGRVAFEMRPLQTRGGQQMVKVYHLNVASKRSLIHNDAEGAYFDMADPRTFVTIMSGITVTQFTYLYLYFGAYLSFSKIAALLGCNRSTVCRGINRAVYRVLYGLPDGLIRMKNMDVLGDAAYQFCTQYSDLNTVLEKMPYFVQRSRQGVWAARKSRPRFLVTQDGSIVAATIDTHGNSKIATTVRGLQRTGNLQRTGFGELLKVLLRRRRGEEDKSVLLEWLNRIFVAYKEKLKKVVHIIV